MSWLHISDFHFRGGDAYDRDVVLRTLIGSVRTFREKGRTFDIVFATGDIANSGKELEYELATQFFDALLSAAGLSRRRLFVVPGNHDVDRGQGSVWRGRWDPGRKSMPISIRPYQSRI